jgi:hypothetical protein
MCPLDYGTKEPNIFAVGEEQRWQLKMENIMTLL